MDISNEEKNILEKVVHLTLSYYLVWDLCRTCLCSIPPLISWCLLQAVTTEDWRDCLALPLTWKRTSDDENTLMSGNTQLSNISQLKTSAGKTVFKCDVGEHVLSTFMCMYCVCLYVYLYYNIFINTRSFTNTIYEPEF